MLIPQPMKAPDFTCLLCGSRLGLTIETIRIGDNTGTCPMCAEPFNVNVTPAEMEELIKAEKSSVKGH